MLYAMQTGAQSAVCGCVVELRQGSYCKLQQAITMVGTITSAVQLMRPAGSSRQVFHCVVAAEFNTCASNCSFIVIQLEWRSFYSCE